MPQRDFDTGTWTDPFFQPLSRDAKLLFLYLWTNDHCNPAGLYEITLKTIAFEASLSVEEIPDLLKTLQAEYRVAWDPEMDLIWVKNFLRRQCKSPKFFTAAMNCLKDIHNNGLIKDFLEYNKGLLIQYGYSINSVSIPSASSSNARANTYKEGVVKGESELPPGEKEIIGCLSKLDGWQAEADDTAWLREFRDEFPFTIADLKACIDYHSGKPPPKHKGIWKNRFRNWMVKKGEFEKGGIGHVEPKRRRPITYIRGDDVPEGEEDLP